MSGPVSLINLPSLYNKILTKFPAENLTYCFAYGSGVFKQINNESPKNMIDFIFTVDNAEKWHDLNLKMNPDHYSALGLFGSRVVANVQTNIPSKVYFNSMIPIKSENVIIKYGVIEEKDLIIDLLDWNYIYVAGRLHKPVEVVHKAKSEYLSTALHLNLRSAVHAALLLLPENFSEVEFYRTIASLSYYGDFRMKIGEDKNKISNIVHGSLDQFRNLYRPAIKTMEEYLEMPPSNELSCSKEKECSQDISPSAKNFHLNNLPRTPQRKLVQFWNKDVRNCLDTEDVLRAMAFDQDSKEIVQLILSKIVWDSSIQQSLKGILTAGIWTSVKYSTKKITKMVKDEKLIMHSDEMEDGTFDYRHGTPFESYEVQSLAEHSDDNVFGPVLPPHLLAAKRKENKSDKKTYGPLLPESLSLNDKKLDNVGDEKSSLSDLNDELETRTDKVIGPKIPKHLICSEAEATTEHVIESTEGFGPDPRLGVTECSNLNYKSDARSITCDSTLKSKNLRESWMLELPQKKTQLFGLKQRHFQRHVPSEQEGNTSGWTDTPTDSGKTSNEILEKGYRHLLRVKMLEERNKEMEKLSEKSTRKLKRKKTLMEIHMKKVKKKKKKEKEKKKKTQQKTVPERRPFDRNIDLQVKKFDERQKNIILNKARYLNDRFAAGESKFL